MKKIFSIVIAGLLLLGTAGTALAAGQTSGQTSGQASGQTSGQTAGGTSGQGADQGGTTQQGKGNTEAYQAGKLQFEHTRQQVRLNAGATAGVKTQLNDCSEQLKTLIQTKLQNRANISTEEMARIKEAIQTCQKERQQIMLEHQGKIQEQVALLNQAKIRGDIDAANAAMNMIQTEQQARIADLNKVLQDLQTLLEDIG
ncbi:MAG: hypothetical protein WHF31_00160 [Candidatus Dehalobacter alkaniphilus]